MVVNELALLPSSVSVPGNSKLVIATTPWRLYTIAGQRQAGLFVTVVGCTTDKLQHNRGQAKQSYISVHPRMCLYVRFRELGCTT